MVLKAEIKGGRTPTLRQSKGKEGERERIRGLTEQEALIDIDRYREREKEVGEGRDEERREETV